MNRVDTLYDQARKGLAQGSTGNWAAAEAMAKLAEQGQSQRVIAAELKCSQETVRTYIRIWNDHARSQVKPTFSEALGQVRDYSAEWAARKAKAQAVPTAPEERAALAAELLKDKDVYEAPAVKQAVDRQVDRQLKQAVAEWNRETGKPTRTEETHDRRRRSVLVNRVFWRDFLYDLQKLNRLLNEATAELDRTGLPDGQAGDIIKAARNVRKAADQFTAAASEHAIGSPMSKAT